MARVRAAMGAAASRSVETRAGKGGAAKVGAAVATSPPEEGAAPLGGAYRAAAGVAPPPAVKGIGVRLRDWALGCALVYLCLFGVGKVVLGEVGLGNLGLCDSRRCGE